LTESKRAITFLLNDEHSKLAVNRLRPSGPLSAVRAVALKRHDIVQHARVVHKCTVCEIRITLQRSRYRVGMVGKARIATMLRIAWRRRVPIIDIAGDRIGRRNLVDVLNCQADMRSHSRG
jgi:hypothetical protein